MSSINNERLNEKLHGTSTYIEFKQGATKRRDVFPLAAHYQGLPLVC